jgi:hypothetical protein
MLRYAVKIIYQDDSIAYECIGKGQSKDAQEAHLYTREDLAEKKAKYYRSHPQWYADAEVITVMVEGL